MIRYTMTTETKDALHAALQAHGADHLAPAGLGRVSRDDSALATAAIIGAWPADADGMHRLALNDEAGLIAWRAYILAEIAARRGRRADIAKYGADLGVQTEDAYDYVTTVVRGTGLRPCTGIYWSERTKWVACSGEVAEPRKRWASSACRARANAHRIFAEVGLTLPNQPTWHPVATALFDVPVRIAPAPMLAPADDAAIADVAV